MTSLNSVGILPHSLIHITHFLPRCGLGKGKNEIHPILQALGIPTDTHYHKQQRSTIRWLYYASFLLFSMELSELMSEYS